MAGDPRDPASLQNLHDIVVAEPVAWWPPAPGWYGVGLALLAGVVWVAVLGWRKRRRNAYRREALQILRRLKAEGQLPGAEAKAVAGVASVIRRAALCAYPRHRVAGLTGESWLEFLDETGGGGAFAAGPGRQLLTAAYRSCPEVSADTVAEVFALAEAWVRTHRPGAG